MNPIIEKLIEATVAIKTEAIIGDDREKIIRESNKLLSLIEQIPGAFR